MKDYWAIDLGTTNSVVARWDKIGESPEMIHIDSICRKTEINREIDVKFSIPSSLYILPPKKIKSLIGSLSLLRKNFFIGRQALIGIEAIEKDCQAFSPAFVEGFKSYLMQDSYRTLTHPGKRTYAARKIASIFVWELLAHIKQKTGKRARNVTFSVPVDSWLVSEFCKHAAYDLKKHSQDPNTQWWYRIMREEACRVKESLFFNKSDTFYLTPPEDFQIFETRVYSKNTNLDKPFDFSRQDLVGLLETRGLYSTLENCLDTIFSQAESRGIYSNNIQEVLLVGGSTLLPEIYSRIEKIFGRDRVRAWQPFNAVAYGACAFASGKLTKSDFITHEYAFLTYDAKTHEPQYTTIIPRGTPFPSARDLWKRQLTPTCPLGEPEQIFKLVICEIGKRYFKDQEFVWDSLGNLHTFTESDTKKPLVIPLNESNPTLGELYPPHSPGDKTARLEISFMVNKDRWLCTTVFDLKTRKQLLVNSPVIRLK